MRLESPFSVTFMRGLLHSLHMIHDIFLLKIHKIVSVKNLEMRLIFSRFSVTNMAPTHQIKEEFFKK